MARILDDDEDVTEPSAQEPYQPRPPHATTAPLSGPTPPENPSDGNPTTIAQVRERVHNAIRQGNARIPPPWHVGLATASPPKCVADLKLAPTLKAERIPDVRATTNSFVIDLPTGMFPFTPATQQKIIADLMTARERGRVAGPIFSVRWVTLGEFLLQVLVDFIETTDAVAVVEQLQSARYVVSFCPPIALKSQPPSTTIAVHDFGRMLKGNGDPLGPAELTTLFSLNAGDLTVVPSFDDSTHYVCFHKGASLFTLLGSPFQSGELQSTLWATGVFLYAVYCLKDAVARVVKQPPPYSATVVMPGAPFPPLHSNNMLAAPTTSTTALPYHIGGPAPDSDDDLSGDPGQAMNDSTALLAGPDLFAMVAGAAAPTATTTTAGGDVGSLDEDFVRSTTQALSLPAELARLIEPAPTPATAMNPFLMTMPHQHHGFFQQHHHHNGPPPPFASVTLGGLLPPPVTVGSAATNWSGPLVTRPPPPYSKDGVLERPATPVMPTAEEEEVAASIQAATSAAGVADALRPMMQDGGGKQLTPAGTRAIVDALLQPYSRQASLWTNATVGSYIVSLKLYDDPRLRAALVNHLPELLSAPRVGPFVQSLATAGQWVYTAVLSEISPSKILALLHTPHFSNNLIYLLRTLPTPGGEKGGATGEDAAAAVTALTNAIVGPVHRQLFSTISGCRFVEAALLRHKVKVGPILDVIASRLAQPEFTYNTELPTHLLSQLSGLLAVCAAAMGVDADTDYRIVKCVSALLHRPEPRRLMNVAVGKVHSDAILPIVQLLREQASLTGRDVASHHRLIELALEFERRSTTGGHGILGATPSKQHNTPTLPEWVIKLTQTYPRRAPPFPAISGRFTVSVSLTHGLYFFKEVIAAGGDGTASYAHPITGAEYAAAPQAYVWDRLLSVRDVVDMVQRSGPPSARPVERRDVERWIDDQRVRDDRIDAAVVSALRIGYKPSPPPPPSSLTDSEPKRPPRTERTATTPPPTTGTAAPATAMDTSKADSYTTIPAGIASYPATGDPFPPLPDGWTAKISSSNGHYYFVCGETGATYKHPSDGRFYPVAPQMFLRRAEVPIESFAQDNQLDVRRVRQWLTDQTARDSLVDAAVLRTLRVTYKERSKDKHHNNGQPQHHGERKAKRAKTEATAGSSAGDHAVANGTSPPHSAQPPQDDERACA